MFPDLALWQKLLLSAAMACAICYFMTPPVKHFAEAVGAMDVPKDERRVHNHPIPRMGGLAIFLGFVLSLLLFTETLPTQIVGLLLGAVIIAVMGAIDDIVNLNAWIKLGAQILAAGVAIRCGIVVDAISNFGPAGGTTFFGSSWLSIAVTMFWIVACTNAVNLIDGLDGLAVGVSAISSFSMMLVSLTIPVGNVPLLLACLTGSCIGCMPYNMNPAKIFMGDAGSQFLGYVLSVVSIMGLFKFHAIITFIVPVLALALPLGDTLFAFFRRILHGQSPFHADRGHIHHKLLDMGMNQKQAVAVLYGISALMGLSAVLISGPGTGMHIVCLVIVFLISVSMGLFLFRKSHLGNERTEKHEAGVSPGLSDCSNEPGADGEAEPDSVGSASQEKP